MSSSRGSLGSLDDPTDMNASFYEEEACSSPTLKKNKKHAKQKPGSLERGLGVDDSALSQSEKNVRIKDRLRHFFSRRPDIELLQQKGIIKG